MGLKINAPYTRAIIDFHCVIGPACSYVVSLAAALCV